MEDAETSEDWVELWGADLESIENLQEGMACYEAGAKALASSAVAAIALLPMA